MQPYDSCRLLHLNLTSFVVHPYTKDAFLDIETLKEVARYAIRLGDDLVDLEVEAIDKIMAHIQESTLEENIRELKLWSKIKQSALDGRRCGVGFTGLADTLAMLGSGYTKDGAIIVETIMKSIFEAELTEEISLAKERGAFRGYSAALEDPTKGFGNDWFTMVSEKFPDLYKEMLQHGRRNVSFSTVAPTGTVSILAQTSSGIEPVFAIYYTRRKKCTEGETPDFVDQNGEKFKEFKIFHIPFLSWAKVELGVDSIFETLEEISSMTKVELEEFIKLSPWYQNTAPEIDWKTRIKIQSIVQLYTTHSISSTLNLPSSTTEKDIDYIYKTAYKYGLKGVTVYRDGSRSGVLVTDSTSNTTFSQHDAPKRPKTLNAELHVVKVKKIKYAVIVGLMENKPYEVFAFELGEGNFLPQKGKVTKIKRGFYNFIGDEDLVIEGIHLASDKVEERASSIYISMLLRHGAPIEYVIETMKKVSENIASFTSAVCRVLMKYCHKEISSEVCPECGGQLLREAGCKKCNNCGYSLCLLILTSKNESKNKN